MSTEVVVSTIPNCDLCAMAGRQVPAMAYAKLQAGNRTASAHVCSEHFRAYGCTLGTGFGQRLKLA